MLIKAGATVDKFITGESWTNSTPLHMAAVEGQADCCLLLLENKANANQLNAFGNAPLHLAALW